MAQLRKQRVHKVDEMEIVVTMGGGSRGEMGIKNSTCNGFSGMLKIAGNKLARPDHSVARMLLYRTAYQKYHTDKGGGRAVKSTD